MGEVECRVALPVRKFEGERNAVLVTTVVPSCVELVVRSVYCQ